MSDQTTTFNVTARKPGKHWSRASRKERMVPAVVYGPKMENVNVLAEELDITRHRSSRFESTLFTLNSDDKNVNKLNVLLRNIQFHPVSGRPVHVDFFALDMKALVKVNVSLICEGTPSGVKDEGGLFQQILTELEIECQPSDIPESLKVDVSGLALNSALHVSDVSLPANAKMITDEKRTICTVNMAKEEKAEEPVATAEAGEAAAADAAPEADKK